MRSHFVIRSLFFTGATLLSQFSNAEEAPKKQPMEIKPFIAAEKNRVEHGTGSNDLRRGIAIWCNVPDS